MARAGAFAFAIALTAAGLAVGQQSQNPDTPVGSGPATSPADASPSPGPPPPVPPAELQREQQQAPAAAPTATPSPVVPLPLAQVAAEAAKTSPAVSLQPPGERPTADESSRADDSAPSVSAPPPPPPPPRSVVAVVQVLDKITAETLKFTAPIGKPIRYKTLVFTARVCETRGAGDPQPRASAYLLIDSQPPRVAGRAPPPVKRVFDGWMFAAAPSANPLQHPLYDAWLVGCTLQPTAPS